MQENTITTSIKIAKSIHDQLIQAVISQSYQMRGKTKWIIDATEDFLNQDEQQIAELADIASEMSELNVVVSMRLPESIMQKIEKAVIVIRKYFPAMEGVKSNIIRASIIQKLLRS